MAYIKWYAISILSGLHKIHHSNKFHGMSQLILSAVLKKKQLSKRQFAKALHIKYPTVFRYFREGYDPKLSTLDKWAKALDVKVRDLIKE